MNKKHEEQLNSSNSSDEYPQNSSRKSLREYVKMAYPDDTKLLGLIRTMNQAFKGLESTNSELRIKLVVKNGEIETLSERIEALSEDKGRLKWAKAQSEAFARQIPCPTKLRYVVEHFPKRYLVSVDESNRRQSEVHTLIQKLCHPVDKIIIRGLGVCVSSQAYVTRLMMKRRRGEWEKSWIGSKNWIPLILIEIYAHLEQP